MIRGVHHTAISTPATRSATCVPTYIGLVVESVEKTAAQYEKIFGIGPWTREQRVHGIKPILDHKFRVEGEKSVASHADPARRRPLDVHEIYLNTDEVIGGPVIQLMQLNEVDD